MTTTPPTEPRLDIVCVLYREVDDFAAFRRCLDGQRDRRFTLTVALNDPTDPIREAVAGLDVFEGGNTGYAGGLERVWRHGRAPWILLANTDLEFDDGTIGRMIEATESVPSDVGLIAPKVLNSDGTLQSVAGLVLGPEGLARPRGLDETDEGQYDGITTAPIPSGCCCLVRRTLLEDVGGFDPDFFMYVEDVDLALKALWRGWDSRSVPELVVTHHHGGAAGRRSDLQLYHLERNHWWVSFWLPASHRLFLPLTLVRRWLRLRARAGELGIGGRSLAPLAMRATLAGWLGLPRMWSRARRLERRLDDRQVRRRLEGHTCTLDEFLAS